MSGGSFNYLYLADFDEYDSTLEEMAEELELLGQVDAAEATRALRRNPTDELRALWRAVEFWRSGDGSQETLEAQANQYIRVLPFDPDWNVAPGETIKETLSARGFGREALVSDDMPIERVEALLAGDEPVTVELAAALQNLTGVSVTFWLALEARYREDLAKGRKRSE